MWRQPPTVFEAGSFCSLLDSSSLHTSASRQRSAGRSRCCGTSPSFRWGPSYCSRLFLRPQQKKPSLSKGQTWRLNRSTFISGNTCTSLVITYFNKRKLQYDSGTPIEQFMPTSPSWCLPSVPPQSSTIWSWPMVVHRHVCIVYYHKGQDIGDFVLYGRSDRLYGLSLIHI